jgi:retron-type reverse transcriptase
VRVPGDRRGSGSYFPELVRAVEIPKDHGAGIRVLGVPNVADRIAQTAAAWLLEERLEPVFHRDSYGYRPGRSAHDALAVTRKRCWDKGWVLDLDIRAFFDSVPRWLTAPMQMPDGTMVAREKGTPQGSPISPLLVNLFMHSAFDRWMDREYSACPFERYADDIVVHCDTEYQAHNLRAAIAERLGALGLELHPEKTKVVFCKSTNRPGTSEHTSFDFLGYNFRGRSVVGRRGRRIDQHLVRWAMQSSDDCGGIQRRLGPGSALPNSAGPGSLPTGNDQFDGFWPISSEPDSAALAPLRGGRV